MNKLFENVDSAAQIIAKSAIEHSIASESGDYKRANKNYDLIKVAVHYLRENNAINKLEQLLSHEDVSVRLNVASYFLLHDEQKAISVLEEIVKLELPHKSFAAKLVVEEYRKGNLKI